MALSPIYPMNKTTVQNGYSRLKKVFTSNFRYKNYNKIVDSAQNKIIGNLPDEILKAAIKTKNKEKTIKTIQRGFADAARELLQLQTLRADAIKKYVPDKEDIIRTYSYILDGEYNEYEHMKKRLEKSILSEDICQKFEKKAEKILKTSMSEILPNDTNIKFKKLGLGNFAEAYKIKFRDNKNNKVFNDYTIKLYRDARECTEINKELDNKIKETLHNLTDTEVRELHKRFPLYKKDSPELWADIGKKFREANKPLDEKALNELKEKEMTVSIGGSSNGVKAEANTYKYIAQACGHDLKNTNLNKHYMFDIENRFNISAFSDKSLPPVTKRMDYTKIGIIPIDAYDNYTNMVYGRIIDVGGMSKISEEYTDKTVRKYFKKIMNRNNKDERAKIINNLKELISNPKTPHRDKIEKAVKLAENIETGYKG